MSTHAASTTAPKVRLERHDGRFADVVLREPADVQSVLAHLADPEGGMVLVAVYVWAPGHWMTDPGRPWLWVGCAAYSSADHDYLARRARELCTSAREYLS